MNKYLHIIYIITLTAILASCGGEREMYVVDITEDIVAQDADQPAVEEPSAVVETPAEVAKPAPETGSEGSQSAFDLGVAHADKLLGPCESLEDAQEVFLEIRSREYRIKQEVGEAASKSYIEGVKAWVRDNAPASIKAIVR